MLMNARRVRLVSSVEKWDINLLGAKAGMWFALIVGLILYF